MRALVAGGLISICRRIRVATGHHMASRSLVGGVEIVGHMDILLLEIEEGREDCGETLQDNSVRLRNNEAWKRKRSWSSNSNVLWMPRQANACNFQQS
jgi:hypothetical protein